VNVRATRQATGVGFIDLLASVHLEGEVLDANAVVAVGATVGWTQAETTLTDGSLSHKVDDFLSTSVGRKPDLFDTRQRPEQVAVEGERPLNVGHGKIDMVYPWRRHRPAGLARVLP
jgi:hypothetical protein